MGSPEANKDSKTISTSGRTGPQAEVFRASPSLRLRLVIAGRHDLAENDLDVRSCRCRFRRRTLVVTHQSLLCSQYRGNNDHGKRTRHSCDQEDEPPLGQPGLGLVLRVSLLDLFGPDLKQVIF